MKTNPISRGRSLPLAHSSLKYILALVAALIINLSASSSFANNPLRYWAAAVGVDSPTDDQLLPVIADVDPGDATTWYTGVHGTTSLDAMAGNYETIINQIGTYFQHGAAPTAEFVVTFVRYVEGIGAYTREPDVEFSLTIGQEGLYIKGVTTSDGSYTPFDVDYEAGRFNGSLYGMADLFAALNGLASANRRSLDLILMYLSEATRFQVIRRAFVAVTSDITTRLRVGGIMDAIVHTWAATGKFINNSNTKIIDITGQMVGKFFGVATRAVNPNDKVGGDKVGYLHSVMTPLIVAFMAATSGAAAVCLNWDDWLFELLTS